MAFDLGGTLFPSILSRYRRALRLNGRLLQSVLAHQTDYRRRQGTVIVLPNRFQLAADGWAPKYAELTAKVDELIHYATLEQAMPLLTAFLDPVLGGEQIGVWQATEHRWVKQA